MPECSSLGVSDSQCLIIMETSYTDALIEGIHNDITIANEKLQQPENQTLAKELEKFTKQNTQ